MEQIAPNLSVNETCMLRLMTLYASPKRQFHMKKTGPENPFFRHIDLPDKIKTQTFKSLIEKECIESIDMYNTSERLIKIKKLVFEM